MRVHHNFGLKDFNTFGLDVKAERFFECASVAELQTLLQQGDLRKDQMLVVGRGSNLLFMSDFAGDVLRVANSEVRVLRQDKQEVVIEVGAGVEWDDLVEQCVAQGWYGIENLSLIPGDTGAAAVQNIGAYGVEICEVIEGVHAVQVSSAEPRYFSVSECNYAYRQSVFKGELKSQYIITSVVMRLTQVPEYRLTYQHLEEAVLQRGAITLPNVRATVMAIRESKLPDPAVLGNAGSFFMNPVVTKSVFEALLSSNPQMPYYVIGADEVKIPAGWLIERCGWKGKSLGKAGVHHQQALVLVNHGGATGEEIRRLAERIGEDVFLQFGIRLVPEVNYIG